MVQVLKSTKYFELFLRLEPWHRQSEHRKFKTRSYFSQMCYFRARNCFFRLKAIATHCD